MASANNRILKEHDKHFQNNCLYLERDIWSFHIINVQALFLPAGDASLARVRMFYSTKNASLPAFWIDEFLHCHTSAHLIFQHPESSSQGLKKGSMLLIWILAHEWWQFLYCIKETSAAQEFNVNKKLFWRDFSINPYDTCVISIQSAWTSRQRSHTQRDKRSIPAEFPGWSPH